jgi:hypothetical protein
MQNRTICLWSNICARLAANCIPYRYCRETFDRCAGECRKFLKGIVSEKHENRDKLNHVVENLLFLCLLYINDNLSAILNSRIEFGFTIQIQIIISLKDLKLIWQESHFSRMLEIKSNYFFSTSIIYFNFISN